MTKNDHPFDITCTTHMPQWLYEMNASLCFTLPLLGKIVFLGLAPDGQLSVLERTFPGCSRLAFNENTLYMASHFQVWRFENYLSPGQIHEQYDRLFVPVSSYTTGAIGITDMSLNRKGIPIFSSGLFSCMATLSRSHSFKPLWMPTFVSSLSPESRCYLSGVATDDGTPRYVTAFAASDTPNGWEATRSKGVVIDTSSNEVVCEGMSYPFSPRCSDDRLWVLNAGSGMLGTINVENAAFEPKIFCHGFPTGLLINGEYALITISKTPASWHTPELTDALAGDDIQSGVLIVHLPSGELRHRLYIADQDVRDIIMIPGARRAAALGLMSDDITRHISPEPSKYTVST